MIFNEIKYHVNTSLCVVGGMHPLHPPPKSAPVCIPFGGQVSAEWSRCSGSMARRARESVAPVWRSSAGWMPARIGRLSAGVGRRHPVRVRKASLMVGSMRRVWALRHQTGVQYSAVECTRAKVAIGSVVAPAPQPEPVSRLKNATRDIQWRT